MTWGGRALRYDRKRESRLAPLLLRFITLSCFVLSAPMALAAPCELPVARAVSVQGSVEAHAATAKRWSAVRLDDVFCQGDSIRVNDNSRASLVLSNATQVRIDANSTLTFSALSNKELSWIDMLSGVAHFISRVKQSFEVVTPFMNAAIEGTEFVVIVESDATRVSVFEGRVAARNQLGEIILTSGQTAQARKGQAPVLQTVVSPRDAVQWALYYPPILEFEAAEFSNLSPTWRGRLAQSLDSYNRGDASAALDVLEAIPEDLDDPRPYLYRAALRLGVGRVKDAESDLARVLTHVPNNSHAIALQALIAVVQNNKTQALTLAERAVVLDATGATPQLALSYARQANFDIEGALAAVEQAVANDDQDALAWSRLAELHLSLGEVEQALTAAEQAVARNPQLARTQSVLGFARLTQFKTEQARQAFQHAIELDQADPLPRLGLGLATLRDGNLAEGREQIEIAASLDPNNALVRSYLGKAYYDEKRDKVAATELANAKQLDPNDPTPWFYDAIRKQTENRPVEALHDLQKSIQLNDNRAVYRSSLLLDQDLAARSASLGRIYDDLGFEQLALVEGWKSVNTDPSNYSAHRLLADSYSALPRHEIARVSELLQSQLLQPLNLTPLQPQLAESNLALLESSGPSDLSFSEFNSLFTRNQFDLQTSGILGSNDTYGENIVLSRIQDRLSYSLGQFHYETDGFRENNDLSHNIYNAFAQISLTSESNLQVELRSRRTKNGDIDFRFDPERFFPEDRLEIETNLARIGYRYAATPNSDLLFSLVYVDREEQEFEPRSFPEIEVIENTDTVTKTDGYTAEIQNIFRFGNYNAAIGIGSLRQDGGAFVTATGSEEGEPFFETGNFSFDTQHDNAYIYTTLNITPRASWVLGLSYDDYEDLNTNRDQFNPKFGLIWNPLPSTTFRLAAFKALKRSLVSNQTLEPTQIAGFNQFFDDFDGTDTRRYGIALDQKFLADFYGGIELSRRETKVPGRGEEQEQFHRAYLHWTPSSHLALSTEYQFDEYERDVLADNAPQELETQSLLFQVGYYPSSGLFANLEGTYTSQNVKFAAFPNGIVEIIDADENFLLWDAAIGYRLPKRKGRVSFEVDNLFDREFNFQDRNFQTNEPSTPRFIPERTIYFRFTLAF